MHYARLAGKHAAHARRVAKARKLVLRYAGAAVVGYCHLNTYYLLNKRYVVDNGAGKGVRRVPI